MSETDRVIELLESNPSLLVDFLAEVGGDPEQYGLAPEDLASLTPASAGPALAAYVTRASAVEPSWAGIDLGSVDWPAVVAALEPN